MVIDDTGFDKKLLSSKELYEVVLNGRHLNITVVIMLQDPASMPLALRGQMDYVFSLGESFPVNQERLYKWFFGVYPSLKDFRKNFEKITSNYGAIVLDNTVQNFRSPNDCIFHYKATPGLRYKFGSPEYRGLEINKLNQTSECGSVAPWSWHCPAQRLEIQSSSPRALLALGANRAFARPEPTSLQAHSAC